MTYNIVSQGHNTSAQKILVIRFEFYASKYRKQMYKKQKISWGVIFKIYPKNIICDVWMYFASCIFAYRKIIYSK